MPRRDRRAGIPQYEQQGAYGVIEPPQIGSKVSVPELDVKKFGEIGKHLAGASEAAGIKGTPSMISGAEKSIEAAMVVARFLGDKANERQKKIDALEFSILKSKAEQEFREILHKTSLDTAYDQITDIAQRRWEGYVKNTMNALKNPRISEDADAFFQLKTVTGQADIWNLFMNKQLEHHNQIMGESIATAVEARDRTALNLVIDSQKGIYTKTELEKMRKAGSNSISHLQMRADLDNLKHNWKFDKKLYPDVTPEEVQKYESEQKKYQKDYDMSRASEQLYKRFGNNREAAITHIYESAEYDKYTDAEKMQQFSNYSARATIKDQQEARERAEEQRGFLAKANELIRQSYISGEPVPGEKALELAFLGAPEGILRMLERRNNYLNSANAIDNEGRKQAIREGLTNADYDSLSDPQKAQYRGKALGFDPAKNNAAFEHWRVQAINGEIRETHLNDVEKTGLFSPAQLNELREIVTNPHKALGAKSNQPYMKLYTDFGKIKFEEYDSLKKPEYQTEIAEVGNLLRERLDNIETEFTKRDKPGKEEAKRAALTRAQEALLGFVLRDIKYQHELLKSNIWSVDDIGLPLLEYEPDYKRATEDLQEVLKSPLSVMVDERKKANLIDSARALMNADGTPSPELLVTANILSQEIVLAPNDTVSMVEGGRYDPNSGQGYKKSRPGEREHAGIDVAAPAGTTINSRNYGSDLTVQKVYKGRDGLDVIELTGITQGVRFRVVLRHVNSAIKEKDVIKKGMPMATVGLDHLHHEIWVTDSSGKEGHVNPDIFLSIVEQTVTDPRSYIQNIFKYASYEDLNVDVTSTKKIATSADIKAVMGREIE